MDISDVITDYGEDKTGMVAAFLADLNDLLDRYEDLATDRLIVKAMVMTRRERTALGDALRNRQAIRSYAMAEGSESYATAVLKAADILKKDTIKITDFADIINWRKPFSKTDLKVGLTGGEVDAEQS